MTVWLVARPHDPAALWTEWRAETSTPVVPRKQRRDGKSSSAVSDLFLRSATPEPKGSGDLFSECDPQGGDGERSPEDFRQERSHVFDEGRDRRDVGERAEKWLDDRRVFSRQISFRSVSRSGRAPPFAGVPRVVERRLGDGLKRGHRASAEAREVVCELVGAAASSCFASIPKVQREAWSRPVEAGR